MNLVDSSFTAALLGGLLSSSCCVVQLALNAFSIGCAGFSALSPYRPYFLGLTSASLALAHLRHRNARQTVAALALAIALSGTPELVRLYNEEGLARLLHGAKSGSPSLAAASPGKDSSPVADSASLETWETVRMRVEGLRCAACAMRLKHALAAEVAGVAAAEVEFESGAVAVHGRGVSKKGLIACAAQLGYSARVLAFQDEPPGGATAQEL